MTTKELKEIVKNGEGSKVEFKLDDISPEKLAKEIVALANFQGGMIILGVGDDSSIVGIKREKCEEWVMNICRNNIEPAIIPGYEEVVIEEKNVAIISLPYTEDKPYTAIEHGRRVYYIRVGTTSRVATREELRRIYQASGEIHYDTVPISASKGLENALNVEKIYDFYKDYHRRDLQELDKREFERFLLNTGILAEAIDNKIYPTAAGLLLFGKEPEQYLFQTGIIFCCVNGTKIADPLIDRKVLSSTLKENIDAFCDLMKNIIPNYPEIVGLIRVEKEIYPDKVVREGVVNALVHRDYTLNSKVRIFLFKDRLEIKSPGGLPNGVTIERMKAGVSVHRNPTLTKFMANYHYMEFAGRGIPMILETMKDLKAKEPEIKPENGEITLILYPSKGD